MQSGIKSWNDCIGEINLKTILAADIGGTNSRFAVFQVDADHHLSYVESKWLKTRDAGSFDEIIHALSKSYFTIPPSEADIAVFAVAGPVESGTYSKPPNIPWEIDVSNIRDILGIVNCSLINDFVAQAFACRSPIIESAQQVVSGQPDIDAPLVVIGAGTGLGLAALVPLAGGGFTAVPSEGGHGSFPFESAAEIEFMNFLLQETEEFYVRTEMVVSGKGLSFVHRFLTGERLDPAKIAANLTDSSKTLKWMTRFYGRVSRNFALQMLSFGGVYITGGVAAKIPALIRHREFAFSFLRTTTMAHVLGKIPVYLNTNEESGLWGAALQGSQLLQCI
jgi:glucokinase